VLPLDEPGKRFAVLLAPKFEFVGFLGKGGFASVYKARNLTLGRFEAVKVLTESRAGDAEFEERFKREARVAASLEHPSIVKVFEFGEAGGHYWYSMQLVDGPTVARELKIRTRLDEEKALKIAIPILDALDYAHNRGVVHRDVKPDNIILDEWDRAYLMDFGIAKLDDDIAKTAAGHMFGSPAYLSPEQAKGETLDGRSDIYSLGLTLYQMLSGFLPFASSDKVATVTRRLTEAPDPLSAHWPEARPELERVVMRALSRDRERRYPAARDMKSELEAVLAEVIPIRGPRAPTMSLATAAATPGAWVGDTSASGSMPTSFGLAVDTTGTRARPAEQAARRAPWLAGALAGAVAALGVYLATRSPAPAAPKKAELEVTHHAPPTAAIAESPTAAPAAAVSTLAPTAAAVPPHTQAIRPSRIAAAAAPAPRPTAERRAKFPPDVAEVAEITLSPELSAECAGRSVGMSVVVAEDGSLKTTKVISPVSAGCDAAALDALRRYKFKPALDEDGKPVEARFSFAVRF
jgi:serine/threonine-protein kinase